MDVIIANDTLQETLKLAETLDNKEIIVLYEKPSTKDVPKTSMRVKTALLVKNVKEAQKNAQKYDYLFGLATRDMIESKLVTHVYGAETLETKDKTHRRGSGLNQVLAKLIVDKEKTYCFDLRLLFSKEQAIMLGRMQQNKRILTKYGCKMLLCSFAEEPLSLRAETERTHFLDGL